ncbi:MAG: hypothetical protein EA396_12545 [Anaerolineaceae bacterium]|nr:MAG: hypothetical protein EA396_12545 [Anaerolineaceae bacterium]
MSAVIHTSNHHQHIKQKSIHTVNTRDCINTRVLYLSRIVNNREGEHMVQAVPTTGQQQSEGMLESAKPDIYRTNAFRVAELTVDTGIRDLNKRQQMVEIATQAEMPIPPGSGRALPLTDAIDPKDLSDALKHLRDPERRLVDELFWFWPLEAGQSRNDLALMALSAGDVDEARNIWLENESTGNVVAVHNLAVMFHAQALDMELDGATDDVVRDALWRDAFQRWHQLLSLDDFWERLQDRVRGMDDPRLNQHTAYQLREALPQTLALISARLAMRVAERGKASDAGRLAGFLKASQLDSAIVDDALKQAIEPLRRRVKLMCEDTSSRCVANNANARNEIVRFMEEVEPLLDALDSVLQNGHSARGGIHDEVANIILQGMIAYGNETNEWDGVPEIVQRARQIAVSDATLSRIDENVKIMQTNIENANLTTKCWFCKQNKADDVSGIPLKLYGDVSYINTFAGTKVVWKNGTIKVPRCRPCLRLDEEWNTRVASVESKGYELGCSASILAFVAACILAITQFGFGGWGTVIFGGVVALLAFSGIFAWYPDVELKKLQEDWHKEHGNRPLRDSYPPLRDLIKKGWLYGDGPYLGDQ